MKPTYCAACNKIMKKGYHCIYCQCTIHSTCKESLKTICASKSKSVVLSDIYNGRGLTNYHDSQYEEAYKDFMIALEFVDSNDKARVTMYIANKGLTAFYLNRLQESIDDLTTAIKSGYDQDPYVHLTRASAYQMLGDNASALADRVLVQQRGLNVVLTVFPYPLLDDLVCQIFCWLSDRDLRACSLTSRKWKNIIYGHHPKLATHNNNFVSELGGMMNKLAPGGEIQKEFMDVLKSKEEHMNKN